MELQSLALLANMLAHKFNIEVNATGTDAYCMHDNATGKTTITVPAFIGDTDAMRVYARGYIDHEIGHARFTNWGISPTDGMFNSLTKQVANILEDVYVERRMGQCYPGCALNLAAMQKQLFIEDRTFENHKPLGMSDNDSAIWYTVRYILYKARGLLDAFPHARDNCDAEYPGIVDDLDVLLDRIPSCSCTQDNMNLAKEIVALLKQDGAQEQQEQQSDGGSNDKSGNGSSAADGDSGTDGADSGSDNGSGAGRVGDGAGKARRGRPIDDIRADHSLKAIAQALEGAANQLSRNAATSQGRVAGHRMLGLYENVLCGTVSRIPSDMIAEASGIAASLGARLQALMQAKVLRKRRQGMTGRLNTNVLHRVVMNNPNVFLRNNEVRQVNTQVVLLGDSSGSMRGSERMESVAMYAVMAALRNIYGVKSAAYCFGGHVFNKMSGFDEPLYNSDMFIANPSGGTPGGSALQLAVQKFDFSRDDRKILIMMTDGGFSAGEDNAFRAAYKEATLAGIDVIGVGIGIDSVAHLWKDGDFFCINSLGDLAKGLLGILERRLLCAA